MKKYQGTKVIEAEPMTCDEALSRGFLPASRRDTLENEGRTDGYHVRYKDGYESWSPKDIFEEAYRPCDTFLDRLHIEHEELRQQLVKLEKFINTNEAFAKLGADDRDLMQTQLHIMYEYLNILAIRIIMEEKKGGANE